MFPEVIKLNDAIVQTEKKNKMKISLIYIKQ